MSAAIVDTVDTEQINSDEKDVGLRWLEGKSSSVNPGFSI